MALIEAITKYPSPINSYVAIAISLLNHIYLTIYQQIIKMYNSNAQSRFQQEPNKQQQYTSLQMYQQIKKKPFTQIINGVQYTYSILCKKRKTFLFGNDRFLYLKGIQSISYARQFPPNKKLPFTHTAEIPQAKATFSLEEIQNFTNQQEQFIITFAGDKKLRWEFVCPNKHCALQWKNKLDLAMHKLSESKLNIGVNNSDDFAHNKSTVSRVSEHNPNFMNNLGSGLNSTFISDFNEFNHSKSRAQYPNNQHQTFSAMLLNPNSQIIPYDNTFKNNKNQANLGHFENNIIINNNEVNKGNFIKVEQNNKQEELKPLSSFIQQQGPKKLQHLPSPKSLFPSKSKKSLKSHQQDTNSSNRPIAVRFRGSTITKVDNFIIEAAHEHDQESQQSISNISPSQKLKIKRQISKLNRNWVEQLIQNKQEVALILNFKNYVQKIAEIIINQLPMEDGSKIFPANQTNKQYALYIVDDVQVQIYFYSEEHLVQKNQRYKNRVIEFKNYDYLLGATCNEGLLIVPLMVLFQYKGFLGMAKNRVTSKKQNFNKQVYQMMDKQQFQMETKIKAEVLLNENHCSIIAVESKNQLKDSFNSSNIVYFVDKLTEFLPIEEKDSNKLLRPQFVQDEELENKLFRDQPNPNRAEQVANLVQQKINRLVNCLETQQQYFTNSKELSQLIHFFGLNMRHIGQIFKKVKQNWLKNLIRADIIARSLKSYFRYDIQNVAKPDFNQKIWTQRQQQRQAKRVISFLNIVFGNTETTFKMWRNVNSFAQHAFNIKVWQNQYTDVNIPYLLLAIQSHLKIVLSNDIHDMRPYFKSMQSLSVRDFIRFQFDTTVYNLDYTDLFQDIHDCLDQQSFDSFHALCELLTKQSNSNVTYFQLLKNHSINDHIRQFLLQFTSPQDNFELYSRIESKNHPSKLIYQSKLAQIRWYFKSQKYLYIQTPLSFIQDHVNKWFGKNHPVLTHLYRTLAEFYSQLQDYYDKALKYANSSLQNQQALFAGDCQYLWKDYFLIGKIHYSNSRFMDSLKNLFKAKELVNMQSLTDYEVYSQMSLMLSKCYLSLKYFKQSYTIVKELYKLIKEQRDERSLILIIESVSLIKQLLQLNQQHQSYERFIQSDFIEIAHAFVPYPSLMSASIKMIALPNLKKVILRSSKNKAKLLAIIDQISKITQPSSTCEAYFRTQIKQGAFPKNYLQCLKEIDSVLQQIEVNHMMDRWKSFNKMTNQSILDKISGSINRGFQFLANMTALFNYLGQQALAELFIMEK